MNPLIIAGLVITAIGLIASSDKKKPDDDPKPVGNKPAGKKKPAGGTRRKKGGVAPDIAEEIPVECIDAEVIDVNAPGYNEKALRLLETILANAPSGFESIREDFLRLTIKNPNAVGDRMADIFMGMSRMCKEDGDDAKADAYWEMAEQMRKIPAKGGGESNDD